MKNKRSERPLRIVVSAGEYSGDQRAASVVAALQKLIPDITIRGMGGESLRALGVDTIVDSDRSGSVMGFGELVGSFGKIYSAFSQMKELLRDWRPDLLLLVDYPDFNIRLAKAAKSRAIPVYYYIPPKVWAWRSWRVNDLRRYVDRTAVIFPFEKEFHQDRGYGGSVYVGHPFLDELPFLPDVRQKLFNRLGLNPTHKSIAIFPGSRTPELKRNVPVAFDAFCRLRGEHPEVQGIVVAPSERRRDQIQDSFSLPKGCVLSVGNSLEVLQAVDAGILKSGTCNLEAAFYQVPFICFYKASPLTAFVVKRFLSISEVSLVNIIRPHTIPEFLQENATAENLSTEIAKILYSPKVNEEYKTRLKDATDILRRVPDPPESSDALGASHSPGNAAERTARSVLALIEQSGVQ
jgi:lipid-A-disaccharide synthase